MTTIVSYFKSLLLFFIFIALSCPSFAQEDIWGNWIMYFGTNRVSDKISIHSEVQYRNHTIAPVNIEQLLLRTGVNYHLNSKSMFTMGYGYIASHDYKSKPKAPESKEHRIFQQFILKNKLNRVLFEHRYRLEQRWVNKDFRSRVRYRLMTIVPLNKKELEKGTVFLGLYDEIFVNTKQTFFDRNRLYAALGYQLNKDIQLQLGYLYQTINPYSKNYLQIAITFNTDFRSNDE